jgi:cation transport regulator ChaC
MLKPIIIVLTLFSFVVNADNLRCYLLNNQEKEQQKVLNEAASHMPELASYPHLTYPNEEVHLILNRFPEGKVLIFGYGSLINPTSAAKNMKPEAVESMKPVVAFGVKRIFNYRASKTSHWGEDQNVKEKAMLNLHASFNLSSMANGVMIEVDEADLKSLIQRETGYDLVPVMVADWQDVKENKGADTRFFIAYTFVVPHELRDNKAYTSTGFYPVRGYMHAIQEGAERYGEDFKEFWNATTYLADGTTTINDWDEKTFKDILCS